MPLSIGSDHPATGNREVAALDGADERAHLRRRGGGLVDAAGDAGSGMAGDAAAPRIGRLLGAAIRVGKAVAARDVQHQSAASLVQTLAASPTASPALKYLASKIQNGY